MNKTFAKRAVGLAAAFGMMITFLLTALPVRAAGLSASASLVPDSVSAGERFVIELTLTGASVDDGDHDVTVSGVGGLAGTDTISASFTNGGASLSTTSGALSYTGSGATSLYIEVGSQTTSARVSGFIPTDDESEEPVTPTTPTGNLIGVKEGTALPEIKAGETKTISIPLTSTGASSRYAGKTQITASLPDGIYFNTATSMQELNFTRTTKDQVLKLALSADTGAKSGVYPITLTSVYKYDGQQVEETLQVNLKVMGKTETEANSGLSIQNYNLDKAVVKAGAGFKLTLTVRNTGNTACQNVQVLLDGLSTDGITVNGGMDTQTITSLAAGASANVSYNLLTAANMTSGNQILNVTASCGEVSGSAKVFVPVEGKPAEAGEEDGPKASKPRVVIDSYSFSGLTDGEIAEEGASSVEGGKTFRLTLNMKNTSAVSSIENVKMTISSAADDATGGVFTPANSSNTFFIPHVGSGQIFTETIDLLVKADAPPKSYGLDVTVSYEAVLDNERVTIDDSETITIPVTQPDRFEVEEVSVWGPIMFGDSLQPSISYVNKGKSSIYNLSIRVEGTNFTTGEATSYVGNVESGTGDYYEATLNPEAPGTVEGKFVLSYEDAAGNLKEVERPFTVEVEEMNWDEPEEPLEPVGPIEPEQQGLTLWSWILIGAGALLVVAGTVVIILKIKKKKAAKKLEEDDDYDD